MQYNYQDAMAIVAKYGKPDIFLTMTCNPKNPDIMNNLPEGQGAEDRPDIVARVFKLHLKELLHDVLDNHVLGVIVAYNFCHRFPETWAASLPYVDDGIKRQAIKNTIRYRYGNLS